MLTEDRAERTQFDQNTQDLYGGSAIKQVWSILHTVSQQLPQEGSLAKTLAICANEVERTVFQTPDAAESHCDAQSAPQPLNAAQVEAIANADAHTSNAGLPTYTEVCRALGEAQENLSALQKRNRGFVCEEQAYRGIKIYPANRGGNPFRRRADET